MRSARPPKIEALVAPIALYPDPLLAQLLPASTYPDQVAEAAAFVAKNGTDGVDKQGWDASVAATARYKEAIELMGSDPVWTEKLGTAFLEETTAVMDAIQQMRSRAKAAGALQNTPQQQVVMQEEVIRIVPSEPEVLYVPQYDPQVIYVEDDDDDWDDAVVAGAIGFGVGVAMGAWLDMDCDWWGHGCYYHGWSGGGNYWSGGNYVNVTRNTSIDNSKVWKNPSRPGGSGNRNGTGNRPGQLPADRRGGDRGNRGDQGGDRGNRGDRGGDRSRPSTGPSTKRDQELARKREDATREMRGKMPSTSDRRGGGDRAGAGRDDRTRDSKGDRMGERSGADRAKGGDLGGSGKPRNGLDSYQRGSDARRSSERGASSRQRSSFDRSGSSGRSSMGRSSAGRSSGMSRGGGGHRGGGGRRR
jgi:hypothetical protein